MIRLIKENAFERSFPSTTNNASKDSHKRGNNERGRGTLVRYSVKKEKMVLDN